MKARVFSSLRVFWFLTVGLTQVDIFEIVRNGSLEELQSALEAGIDVNTTNQWGETPLMQAIGWNQFEMVIPLLDAGADVEIRDVNGWSAVTYAQRHGAEAEIKAMLRLAGPKAAAQEDFFKLIEGASLTEVQEALTENIDLNAYDSLGHTMLIRAAFHNPYPEVIQFLLDKGLDINGTNKLIGTQSVRGASASVGLTPLNAAAQTNPNPKILEVLVKAGADLNAMQGHDTPLMNALKMNKNLEVAYTLIRHGADVNLQDYYGDFPLKVAVRWDDLTLAKALLDAGASVSARSQDARGSQFSTFEPVFVYLRSKEMLELLLEYGAQVNPESLVKKEDPMYMMHYPLSIMPLMYVAMSNPNPDVLNTLIRAGANVNAKDVTDKTALMFAAQTNPNPEIITILLTYGADPLMIDSSGKTAFDYVQMNEALKNTEAYRQLEIKQ